MIIYWDETITEYCTKMIRYLHSTQHHKNIRNTKCELQFTVMTSEGRVPISRNTEIHTPMPQQNALVLSHSQSGSELLQLEATHGRRDQYYWQ